jgi:hypothetical protein
MTAGAFRISDRYCITVRDCYEKALWALCAGTNLPDGISVPGAPSLPRQLAECFHQLSSSTCPDPAAPFPCEDGCRAEFTACTRTAKPRSFVGRGADHEREGIDEREGGIEL